MSTYPPQQQYPQYPQKPYPQPAHPQAYPGGPPGFNPFSDQAPNPYAMPPQAGYYAQPVQQKPSAFAGLWRQGNVMVMHKLAPLPDICLKSNQPATRRLKRNVTWHHPALAITILAGLLIYVILALILTKRATIHVPLTEDWFARRQRRLLFSWGIGLVSIALMVGGVVLTAQLDDPGYLLLLLVGVVAGLVTLIAGAAAVGMVSPKRMTDEFIWLKGVHPDFLNRLEIWPYHI
jgi:hypothetical protein